MRSVPDFPIFTLPLTGSPPPQQSFIAQHGLSHGGSSPRSIAVSHGEIKSFVLVKKKQIFRKEVGGVFCKPGGPFPGPETFLLR